VFPANLGHGLALVLLTQNTQNLGLAETTLFHEQLKIEKVKSYYFSLLFTGLLSGEAYIGTKKIPILRPQVVVSEQRGWRTVCVLFRDSERQDRTSVPQCADL